MQMKYNIIVACCKNWGIGYKNGLAWSIPSDLKKFRQLTIGEGNNAVIMGRNTWLSLPVKYLKSRDNLILSTSLNITTQITEYIDNSQNDVNNQNKKSSSLVKAFKDIDTIIDYCNKAKYDCVWIIGGAEIYNLFLSRSDIKISEIHMTWIDQDFQCDTFFPIIDNDKDKDKDNDNDEAKKTRHNNFVLASDTIHEINSHDSSISTPVYDIYDRVYYHLSK